MSSGVQIFEDDAGTAQFTKAYLEEIVDDMYLKGQNIIVWYVEYFGFWFFTPTFSYPYDYDASRTGEFWHDLLGSPATVENFDAVGTILERAQRNGQKVILGLGRNGDTPLIQDLKDINIGGNPDPNRYGLSINTRLSNAVARTREVAADLVSQYGSYSSFYGFYLSHETGHIGVGNNYYTACNTGAGADPNLQSYGKEILIAPGNTVDLAGDSTFAAKLDASGATIFAPQDAVGAGTNLSTGAYTFSASTTIPQLASYFGTWKTAADLSSVELWSVSENWRMDGPTYDNDYPAAWAGTYGYSAQLSATRSYVSQQIQYATLGYIHSDDFSLRPRQPYHGKADYRDRAESFSTSYCAI